MNLRPTHKAIKAYQAALDGFAGQQIHHELAVRSAFQTLLADAARIDVEFEACFGIVSTRFANVPDGTLRDEFSIPRGFWEAKDTHDDLDAEIESKIAKGYRTTNIIFEDTQRAVLYQDGRESFRVSLRSPTEIAGHLTRFRTRHHHALGDIANVSV